MIDVREVNWNQVWKERRAGSIPHRKDARFWDERASSYAKAASETGYAEKLFNIMKPQPHWRVLDMACGGGTLTLPLARQVKMVTAVDFSHRMLAILDGRCRDNGISNIKTIRGRWEDDWEALGIGRHDVAIASRALVSDDLRSAILKLDAIARECVYIITTVGDGPYDRRMFEAIGRPLPTRPDFIYPYNLLYQMGILAEVNFIDNPMNRTFASPGEAFDSVIWMFDGLNTGEDEMLRSYLDNNLVCRGGKWALSYKQVIRWAVIRWTKEAAHRRE